METKKAITQRRKTTEKVNREPPPSENTTENDSSHQSDFSDISSTSKHTPPKYKQQYNPESYSETSGSGFYVACCIVCLLLVAGAFFLYNSPSKHTCSFDELQKNNSQQPELVWLHLSVGIGNILNKIEDMPAVYLFVHEKSSKLNGLIKDIAKRSSACFGHEKTPVEMQFDDFKSENDYGYAIEQYKKTIKQGQVILIANLNKIPAATARALHVICDVQNPIVKNVVIFLTLTVPSMNTGDKPITIAEDTLVQLWGNKMPRNELDSLITRVTDQVIPLKR